MTFDPRIATIGYGEPALWLAVVASGGLAAPMGALVGMKLGQIIDPWRRRLYGGLANLGLVIALWIGTIVLVDGVFYMLRGGSMACTVSVAPALIIPAMVGVAVESLMWRKARLAAH